jgi:retinol dehydrogenase-12/retinol dehydrogenase-13
MLGAEVVIACRNETKGRRVADAINASLAGRKDAGRVVCMVLDLKSLENVRTFVAAYRKVHRTGPHLLINNAGLPPKPGQRSTDGFELGLGVMHFGHFYLTKLLRPGIEAVTGKTREDPARIVTVASAAHGIAKFDSSLIDDKRGEGDLRGEITDGGFAAYGRAKLANVLFARELPQRWAGTHVASHSLHPGAVRSEIWRNKNKIFESFWNFAMLFVFRATDVAAQVIIYLLVDRTSRGPHSIYANCFAEDAQESLAEPALDPLLAARLWDVSERVVADFEASTTDNKKSK